MKRSQLERHIESVLPVLMEYVERREDLLAHRRVSRTDTESAIRRKAYSDETLDKVCALLGNDDYLVRLLGDVSKGPWKERAEAILAGVRAWMSSAEYRTCYNERRLWEAGNRSKEVVRVLTRRIAEKVEIVE